MLAAIVRGGKFSGLHFTWLDLAARAQRRGTRSRAARSASRGRHFEKVGQLIDSAKEAEIVTPDFSVSAKDKRQRKRAPDRARPDGAAEGGPRGPGTLGFDVADRVLG